MKKIMIAAAAMVLSGCAAMNENECLTADWKTVGFENGTQGLHASNITRYRESCAKHGIAPNLPEYQAGYNQGLKSYCTKGNGFTLGKSGNHYRGVCPSGLEDDFLHGYQVGRTIYTARKDYDDSKRAVKRVASKIDRLEKKISEQELLLNEFSQQQATHALAIEQMVSLERDLISWQLERTSINQGEFKNAGQCVASTRNKKQHELKTLKGKSGKENARKIAKLNKDIQLLDAVNSCKLYTRNLEQKIETASVELVALKEHLGVTHDSQINAVEVLNEVRRLEREVGKLTARHIELMVDVGNKQAIYESVRYDGV